MLAYFSHNDPNDDDSEEEDDESDESVEDEERDEDSVSDGTKEATKVLFKIPREKVEHAGPASAVLARGEKTEDEYQRAMRISSASSSGSVPQDVDVNALTILKSSMRRLMLMQGIHMD